MLEVAQYALRPIQEPWRYSVQCDNGGALYMQSADSNVVCVRCDAAAVFKRKRQTSQSNSKHVTD